MPIASANFMPISVSMKIWNSVISVRTGQRPLEVGTANELRLEHLSGPDEGAEGCLFRGLSDLPHRLAVVVPVGEGFELLGNQLNIVEHHPLEVGDIEEFSYQVTLDVGKDGRESLPGVAMKKKRSPPTQRPLPDYT